MRAHPPTLDVPSRPVTFTVGAHAVIVAQVPPHGRWTVTVDGTQAEATFESQVDAWSEGVRLADRLDRGAAPTGR